MRRTIIPIDDISPRDDNATIVFNRDYQSVSGKALCCAISSDGSRAYVGGHSGVWRSDDGGLSWWHPEWPQPPSHLTEVPGALLAPNVYDLLIPPSFQQVLIAATGRDARRPDQSGIYRSTDGGQNWSRVHTFRSAIDPVKTVELVGCLAAPPDGGRVLFAAGGSGVARSFDVGATWQDIGPQGSSPSDRRAWYVAAARRTVEFPELRRVYAIGESVWYSIDNGDSWQWDPVAISLDPPSDGAGASSRSIGVHPSNPSIIYVLVGDGRVLWRGEFPPLPSTGPGTWTQLPTPSKSYPGTTASGGGFVVPHVTPDGELCLIVSDRRTTHICRGEPTKIEDWHRIEDANCHLDPHGFALTPEFRPSFPYSPRAAPAGRAILVNDGGVNVTTDGGLSWMNGEGLSTLGIVNVAVNQLRDQPAAICIGMGDNSGFSTRDGAESWITQHYVGGDQDCCFADPLDPERLVVFSPRFGPDGAKKGCLIYSGSGEAPDAGYGTQNYSVMEAPPFLGGGDKLRERGHNIVSNFYNAGYRPLVLTCAGETPRPDGDFVVIRFTADQALLLRTTQLSAIDSPNDWVTTATSESQGTRTFRQGPPLPTKDVSIVQASGGHQATTFYVGDQTTGSSLWKWTEGMRSWKRLVPRSTTGGRPAPNAARRFFADPYRPSLIYVLADNGIWRSDDGGNNWVPDEGLESAITEGGAFPIDVGRNKITDGTPDPALLRDMLFDPFRAGCRFALGPAGAFHTQDGLGWAPLLRASAIAAHINNGFYDPVSCNRVLYIATSGRGLLRISPIPPDWEFPIGSLQATAGRITLLRVHDVDTGFGPPYDFLDAEVIVQLDSEPEKSFGIQLRTDAEAAKARAMLELLRDAFRRSSVVRLEFIRSGCRTAKILRVIAT